MKIDEILKWLEENKYDYNISKEGETHTCFDNSKIVGIGTTNPDVTFNINNESKKELEKEKREKRRYRDISRKARLFEDCIKEAIQIGRKYMKEYDYDSEDKPTQQEWDLALTIFNHRINGGFN